LAQNLVTNIADSTLSYGENPESLSRMGFVEYRDVTERQTDEQTELL